MIRPADSDDNAGDRGADPDRDAWTQIDICQREKKIMMQNSAVRTSEACEGVRYVPCDDLQRVRIEI